MAGGLGLDRADGLLELVVVEQRLGEADDGVDPVVAVEAGHAERALQMVDGDRGVGQQGGAAEFVEDVRVHLGEGRLRQRAFQAAAGRVGRADGEVFAGGLAQLLDQFLVVVRVHLQQVPGGLGGAAAALGDHLRGHAVHGGAHAGRDGVVDGGGDEGVDELELAVGPFGAGGRLGFGEDAVVAEEFGARPGQFVVHGGEFGDHVDGDAGAEDGGGPGEPGCLQTEALEPVDQSAAAGGAVERAQFSRLRLDRLEFAVLHLGEEFDGVVGVAAGDGPDLAAERVVGVPADGGTGESGGGVRGEGAEGGDGAARGGHRVEQTGAVPSDLAGPAGDHDEDGQVVQAFGEGGEPAQGLLVGPVRVVDEQDQRPLAAGEPAHRGDEPVADVLRVGVVGLRFRYAEGGSGDVVPVAEVLAGLLGQQGQQRGLEELPYDVERDGSQCLGAACGPDGAAPAFGDAPGLGQQCGLAESRLAPDDQQAARGRLVRAQDVECLCDGGELGVPLPQGSRAGRRRPSLRHPVTSPGRPNDVQTPSVAVGRGPRWPLASAVARPGETGGGRATRPSARPADGVSTASAGGRHREIRGKTWWFAPLAADPLIPLSRSPHTVGA